MNDKSEITHRTWPAFLAGAVTALLLAGIGLVAVAGLRNITGWGNPHTLTDESVRAEIQLRGVILPESAHHLYYFIAGFMDPMEFISFRATQADCMGAAQAFAGLDTSSPVFVAGTQSRHPEVNKEPAFWGPKWATPLWDIRAVRNGTMYETKRSEGKMRFVLVDMDKELRLHSGVELLKELRTTRRMVRFRRPWLPPFGERN